MQQPPTRPTIEQRFGQAVHEQRTLKGWSQREFAERLTDAGIAVDASAVSRIENGTRALRLVEAVVIADVLGQSLQTLLLLDKGEQLLHAVQGWGGQWANAQDRLVRSVETFTDLQHVARIDLLPQLSEALEDNTLDSTARSRLRALRHFTEEELKKDWIQVVKDSRRARKEA